MDKIVVLLEQLAQQLGTTVPLLWGILIKQAWIEGLSGLLGILTIALTTYPFVKWMKYVIKEWNGKICQDDTETLHGAGLIVLGSALFIFIIAASANVTNIISALFNPEYWALNHITEMLVK